MSSAVVSGRENGEKLSSCESFKTIHDALMSSQNVFGFVCLQEVSHSIRSEFDNISRSIWISNEVWLDSKILVTVGWIRPKDINNQLLLCCRDFVDNL